MFKRVKSDQVKLARCLNTLNHFLLVKLYVRLILQLRFTLPLPVNARDAAVEMLVVVVKRSIAFGRGWHSR